MPGATRPGAYSQYISQHPDFRESLRRLIEDEQYTFADVGMMFGVSRERVRQWCAKHGIIRAPGARGTYAVRQWDDARNRFIPISRGVLQRSTQRARRDANRRQRIQRRFIKQSRIVSVLAEWRASHGRDPTWREIWLAIGGDPATPYSECCFRVLAAWAPLRANKLTVAEKTADFRRATGIKARHIGFTGWTPTNQKRKHLILGGARGRRAAKALGKRETYGGTITTHKPQRHGDDDTMQYLIKLEGLAIPVATEHDGRYLAAYDPTKHKMRGEIRTTDDPAQALHFDDIEAATECWRQDAGVRPDGKKNRPLTAWSVSIIPITDNGEIIE